MTEEIQNLPVIAIVGRPNVGKSTLFNRLTRAQDALVVDLPGTTRDRKYGEGQFEDKSYIVVDTGGIGDEEDSLDDEMSNQSWLAASEADLVLFVVDAKAGLMAADTNIATRLRRMGKPINLVVNKIDGLEPDVAQTDFYTLGFDTSIPISASQKRGIKKLMAEILAPLPQVTKTEPDNSVVRVAIVGQPNVGKSTLINRMLGEERLVVFDRPGTTRDSIEIPFKRDDQDFVLIDTAGVRRKSRVKETVEKFSIVKTLQAVESSNVVVFLLDAQRGVVDQDLTLLKFVCDSGRALVIAVNKWDGLDNETRERIKKEIGYKIKFVDYAKWHFISALHGSGVGLLYDSIMTAFNCAKKAIETPILNEILENLVTRHQPPLVNGRRVKLKYAHIGGHNPPRVIIHGNQTDKIPASYKRYLVKNFIELLKLEGTPLWVEFKSSDNPYKDKKNKLTPRQERKRKRLIKHFKKKDKKK